MENDTLIGQQIGAYSIQSKLGEGGMARVYKGYHMRLRREVAIKVILAQVAEQADFKARFEREAQLVASLQHPNIVAVYDFGDYGSLTYLVMQYVSGGTLRDRLRGGHALDPRQAMIYAIQMGKALHHAHLRGIVHRDVKPQNMLVSATDPNHLLLSDFGIAKLYDTRYEPALTDLSHARTIGSDPSLTNIGQIVGTPDYMAPEQIEGRPIDARTDVYTLGVVLFQMLTGETPFRATTAQGLYYQHVVTPPPGVREVNPYVSEQLAWIVSKAMAKIPAARFQSAEEMAQALEEANRNATYQLQPSISQQPLVGQDTQEPVTAPSQPRPSFYGPQAATPNTGVATRYGTQSGGMQIARPAPRLKPFSYVAAGLVIVLAVVLILARTGLFSSVNTGGNTTAAQSFTETFYDNHLQWLNGSSGGLNATVNPNSYVLDIPMASPTNTYFPYPKSVGSLPTNFTWSAKMEQTKGPTDVFYGLAFRLAENGSSVSCYAFVIDSRGDYQVLKYVQGNTTPEQIITRTSSAITSGLGNINTLQATVQNNSFSFTVNGSQVDSQHPSISDNVGGSAYTGGEPSLFVAGSSVAEVSFTVTWAQLTVG